MPRSALGGVAAAAVAEGVGVVEAGGPAAVVTPGPAPTRRRRRADGGDVRNRLRVPAEAVGDMAGEDCATEDDATGSHGASPAAGDSPGL